MPKAALLIIDMFSPYDFEGGVSLAEGAEPVIERIADVRRRADEASVPVVFANDVDDQFSGSRERVFEDALEGDRPELVRPLEPGPDDRFVHKGQHSAFYGTPLAHMLHLWEVEELVLTGQVTEQCVLYTALDAHVRHYTSVVLEDCVLSIDPELGEAAKRMMVSNMSTRISDSKEWQP